MGCSNDMHGRQSQSRHQCSSGSSKATQKKLEAELKLLNSKIVSLADLSAALWDKGTCLAEHDHLENRKHCWFKDKIKGLESKAEADIKECVTGFPGGEKVCIPVKQFREKLLSAPGHSHP